VNIRVRHLMVGLMAGMLANGLPDSPLSAQANRVLPSGADSAGVRVGGVVVGLLIGGDAGAAVAIGGGVVGLIGLYRYLR
jgi:hypothetical protein